MVKDFFDSIKNNFNEKSTNPILGTYLLVCIVRNWDLIYTLFNFDNEVKLQSKINFISEYYEKHEFVTNLLINVLWSFAILILTYIVLNISRFIINLSEKQITPWIYKLTDSKSIVLRTEYDRIRLENYDLQSRLDNERDSKSKLEMRIKNLQEEIIEITKPISIIKNESNDSNEIEAESILFQKLKSKDLVKEFSDITLKINKNEAFEQFYAPIDKFLELGLIQYVKTNGFGEKYYGLTTDGQNVIRKIRLEK